MRTHTIPSLIALFGTIALSAGCAQMGLGGGKAGTASETATAAPATAKAPSAGVNSRGEVTDSSQVSAGEGRKVKGRDGWEGEVTGKAAPGSKFNKLEIGMPMKQVTDLIGSPSDQGVYLSGKAWIPFYFGSDRHRHELVYKNQGRLIFAGPAGFQFGSGNLIWIIHNPKESGTR